MTHISEEVQIDSLKVLDLCLEFFPSLFVSQSHKILRDFAELISKKQEVASSSKVIKGSKQKNTGISALVNRELIVNPKGRLSSAKIRHKILERLDKMLGILVSNRSTEGKYHKSVIAEDNTREIVTSETEKECLVVDCTLGNTISVPLYKYTRHRLDIISHFDSTISSTDAKFEVTSNLGGSSLSSDSVRHLATTFAPLLFDCWIECNAAEFSAALYRQSDGISTLSAMVTISRIINWITYLIIPCKTLGSNKNDVAQWFSENYFEDFCQYFVKSFPYNIEAPVSSIKSKNKESFVASVLDLNIILAEITCFFTSQEGTESKIRRKWSDKIMKFVNETLAGDGQSAGRHIESIIRIVLAVVNIGDGKSFYIMPPCYIHKNCFHLIFCVISSFYLIGYFVDSHHISYLAISNIKKTNVKLNSVIPRKMINEVFDNGPTRVKI